MAATTTTQMKAGWATQPRRVLRASPRTSFRSSAGSGVSMDDDKDSRTVFIGNLSTKVAQSKSLKKQLSLHITSLVPQAKLESIRFRSLSIKNPAQSTTSPQQERAKRWKETHAQHPYLTSNEKRRIAFIKKDFHSDIDSTTAYIVFHPIEDTDIAQAVVDACDGTVFMERTIRVDRVGHHSQARTDPKRTVFVGNLDLGAKEEDLRAYFDSFLTTELGPVPQDEDTEQSSSLGWVTHIRLVRDKATQLGKGFAYVEFKERQCVDEVLSVEPGKLKFAKRRLRVQKCKANGDKDPPTSTPKAATKDVDTPPPAKRPDLGAQLANLSKEERKAAKASDLDRNARRLAKKKARLDLSRRQSREQASDRPQRKRPHHSRPASSSTKKRVRSDKSILKKNSKK